MRQADACGRNFLDMLEGRTRFEVVERDDGYIDASDGKAWYFAEYKDWSEREKAAMRLARGRVLDVGCGPGRHCLYLQRRGLDVTGLDLSPLNVRICRKRGLKKTLCMPVEAIGKLKPASFDTILMMGNNFGLFGSFAKARRLLKAMDRLTTPGGRIIAETLDPYQTENPDHLAYQARNRRRGRMSGQVRIRIRHGRMKSGWWDYLFVSKDELLAILEGTAWKLRRTFVSGGPQYIAVLDKRSP